jgi:hypothetical protein
MTKVNYQPVAEDPQKSCINCKNFQTDEENTQGIGRCFGHEVSSKGSCNFFEEK